MASEKRGVILQRLLRICLVGVMALLTACDHPAPPAPAAPKNGGTVRVAVASNMVPAFEKLSASFTADTQTRVIASSGASGVLAEQIRNGAPMDLLLSADTKRVLELKNQGLVVPETYRVYAIGVLVLARHTDGSGTSPGLEDLKKLPANARIALPNPETAPYGAAALAAIKASGMEADLNPYLVVAENVGQARQYLASGNVQYAFLPLSLVDPKEMDFAVVPETLYPPIEQALAVVKKGENLEGAKALADFVTSEKGQAILVGAGYKLPGS